MTQRFPPWPPLTPFPESLEDTVGDGAPDFPGSSGDRERGKFRPSKTPKLTQVSVVNDDGTVIGYALIPFAEDQLIYLQAIVRGLEIIIAQNVPAESVNLLDEVESDS